jgi:hypothetical protein
VVSEEQELWEERIEQSEKNKETQVKKNREIQVKKWRNSGD